MHSKKRKKLTLERLVEILEPTAVWILVLFIIIGSFLFPFPVVLFVVIFNIYFLFQTFKVAKGVVLNTIRIKIISSINWANMFTELDNIPNAIEKLKMDILEFKASKTIDSVLTGERTNVLTKIVSKIRKNLFIGELKFRLRRLQYLQKNNIQTPRAEDVKHVFIIATAFEPPQLIARLITTITSQNLVENYGKNILILLGQESANKDFMQFREEILSLVDTSAIQGIWFNVHDLDLENETKGKHSNVNSVARNLFPRIESELSWNPETTLVHVVDTPIVLNENYASLMAYEFVTQPVDRKYKIYSSCILFYNNIWDIPLPNRMSNTTFSLWNIYNITRGYHFVPISSYTSTMWLAKNVNYWDTKVIPEDHHYFYNSFYTFGDKIMSVPIFLFTGKDAAQAKSYWRTYKNQYNQYQRWAYGISDIGYVVRKTLTSTNVPFFSRLRRLKEYLRTHFLWPTSWFVVMIGTNLPFLINTDFRRSLSAVIVPDILSITTLSFISLFVVILIVDIFIKPKKSQSLDNSFTRSISLIQWIAFPAISFIYSSLPALDAHTRLMLGKYLQYKITEKVAPKPILSSESKIKNV